MNERLQGKTVMITGATSGLGEQIAFECAKHKANLILLARNEEKLKNLKQYLSNQYAISVLFFPVDLNNLEEIEDAFVKIVEKVETIDVLVNNAGFGIFKTVADISMDEVENMFRVNVLGLIAVTKFVLPLMMRKRYGHIINIASQAGKIATPKASVYSATKKAVLGFTDSLRMEVKEHGIFVTAVNPGPMATNFFQIADPKGHYVKNLGRWLLQSEKVAKIITDKMLTNTREINLPRVMNAASKLHALFPSTVERIGKKAFFKK